MGLKERALAIKNNMKGNLQEDAKINKLRKNCLDVIESGMKDLKVYASQHPNGITNEVTSRFLHDLENRKKSISKMSRDSLKADCEDIMFLVENRMESNTDNELTRKMENNSLEKVYKTATNIYQSLDKNIRILIHELDRSGK